MNKIIILFLLALVGPAFAGNPVVYKTATEARAALKEQSTKLDAATRELAFLKGDIGRLELERDQAKASLKAERISTLKSITLGFFIGVLAAFIFVRRPAASVVVKNSPATSKKTTPRKKK